MPRKNSKPDKPTKSKAPAKKKNSKSWLHDKLDQLDDVKPDFSFEDMGLTPEDFENNTPPADTKKPKKTVLKASDSDKPEPYKPGKHRFFAQNYQHNVYAKDDSGYAVAYQLRVKADDYDKIQRLLGRKGINEEFEPHLIEFLEEGFLVHSSWDRFEKDLKLVSTKLKNVLLRVDCVGEDFPADFYSYFIKNGLSYYEDAEILMPEFNEMYLS